MIDFLEFQLLHYWHQFVHVGLAYKYITKPTRIFHFIVIKIHFMPWHSSKLSYRIINFELIYVPGLILFTWKKKDRNCLRQSRGAGQQTLIKHNPPRLNLRANIWPFSSFFFEFEKMSPQNMSKCKINYFIT